MNSLMQWRISARLAAAFAAVLVLVMGFGVLSISRLSGVNDVSTEIEVNWLPSVAITSAINTNTSDFRILELQHVLSQDEKAMDRIEEQIKAQRGVIADNQATYEKLISSPEERKRYDAFASEWNAYLGEHEKLMKLSSENKTEEAFALLNGESQKLFDGASAKLMDLVNLNTDGAKEASHLGNELFVQTRLWIIGGLAVVVFMGAVFAWMISRSIVNPVNEAVRIADRIAGGDLTQRIQTERSDETGQLIEALRKMQQALSNLVTQVRDGADGVATASAQIAQGNQDLSSRTEQQASALEETSASMEEMGSTASQNADNARAAMQMADGASQIAREGGSVVSEVVTTMTEIQHSSQKINEIISTIDGIAFQTNILALNAAVEAARAGEQGRGFAVVAGEVRTLAQRSAEAAKQIKQLIQDSVEKVERGNSLVGRAGTTMNEIVLAVQRVTDIVGEISSASAEQNAGVNQVSEAISNMDQTTQQNAALVEESASAAAALRQQADQLVSAVSVFRVN